jgi:PAS domain S-box-containing protein
MREYFDGEVTKLCWRSGDSEATRIELGMVYDALNSSVNGVLIADPQGQIVYVNPAFLRMFEYGGEMEVIGRNAGDLFVVRDVERLADVKTAVDAVEENTLELSVQRRDGSVFPVEVSASNVTDGEGKIAGRMASFADVSARKEIGHTADLIVDDEAWIIRYILVDTRDWLPGKKVLVSPSWAGTVAWPERNIYIGLSRETVKNSPEFDPFAPVNREYELRLYNYYSRPKYWTKV